MHFDILKEVDISINNKKKFVEDHKELLELAKELNDLIGSAIFIQFLISSMLLCVLGFQIVVLEDIFQRFAVAIFGLAIIIQLFIYSYGGEILMDKSSEVAQNFYNLDKDYVLIIARAQKASIFQFGFYRADLPTFSSILSSAASLITLLKSFL